MVERENYSGIYRIYHYLHLGRPLFLLGGISLHGLGVFMALTTGAELNIAALLWGQLAITSIQLMTHYSNDYFDLAADKANTTPTRWSGGSRILAEGYLDPKIALTTAVISGVVGLFAALWLAFVVETGTLTLPFLLLSLVFAWSYSSPPLQLNMHGLGELTGALLITGLTPLVGFYLQVGQLSRLPFLAVFPLCCFQFAMLLVINFPDAEGDAAAGKHTLLFYIGPAAAVRLYSILLAAAYVSLPLLLLLGLPALAAVALFAVSPLAAWQGWRMAQGAWADPGKWNSLGFWSVGLLMASVTAELLAFSWIFFYGD
jgi:1,4-dihydroxy-2-naphthoate octaprenyltransferase